MKLTAVQDHHFVPATHEDPQKPGVLKKVLFNAEDFDPACGLRMLNYAVIQPGESFRSHFHESLEEVFYILTGKGELTIDGETRPISAGMAVIIPKKAVHSMKNVGTDPLEYLAFGASLEIQATVVTPQV